MAVAWSTSFRLKRLLQKRLLNFSPIRLILESVPQQCEGLGDFSVVKGSLDAASRGTPVVGEVIVWSRIGSSFSYYVAVCSVDQVGGSF